MVLGLVEGLGIAGFWEKTIPLTARRRRIGNGLGNGILEDVHE